MTFAVVTAFALLGTAPWWWNRGAVRRRVVGLGPDASPADDAEGRGHHRVGSRARPGGVDVPVLLELVAAAVRAGAGVPRALDAVADAVGGAEVVGGADAAGRGGAVGGTDAEGLHAVAAALRLGADWEDAWAVVPDTSGELTANRLAPLRRALRGAWVDGAAPGEALRAAGQDVLAERRAAARTAAGRLGVRLVVPLGVCYLPAFVLLGLVPVLLALGLDLLAG